MPGLSELDKEPVKKQQGNLVHNQETSTRNPAAIKHTPLNAARRPDVTRGPRNPLEGRGNSWKVYAVSSGEKRRIKGVPTVHEREVFTQPEVRVYARKREGGVVGHSTSRRRRSASKIHKRSGHRRNVDTLFNGADDDEDDDAGDPRRPVFGLEILF